MTIEKVYRKNKISVRSYNVCIENGLYMVDDLLRYYEKHKTFKAFKKCGRKTQLELTELCEGIDDLDCNDEVFEETEEFNLENVVKGLSRTQREVINSFILATFSSLKVRSVNAINLYLDHNLKIKNFSERILLNRDFEVSKLRNIGKLYYSEVATFVSKVEHFVIKVSKTDDNKKLISLKNNFLIKHAFSVKKIPNEILETESIFLLSDFILDQNLLFDENRTIIMKYGLKLYKNQEDVSNEIIADLLGLSRERVRQVIKVSIDELFNKLKFIKNFNDDLLEKYNIDVNLNFIEINDELIDKINSVNNTNLSRGFITYILFVFLSEEFALVGNIEDVFLFKKIKYRSRYDWKNTYLVRKKVEDEFSFADFVNDIDIRVNDRIYETYIFSFKGYISRFSANENFKFLDLVFPIAEYLLNEEFGIYLNVNENIIFKRNTLKQVYEYVYEALDQLGKPSKVVDIYHKVLELYPHYDTDVDRVRSSMKRNNGFVPLGRKSIFGLKKWETELENFKGGTIRKIVEEFLDKSDSPKHITEITEYVLVYRPNSSQKSIIANIKLDDSGVFCYFKGSMVGLSRKKYNPSFVIVDESDIVKKKSWEERYQNIVEFTKNNNRLPYSSSCPKSEEKLYRWFNVQLNKIIAGKLEKNKEILIRNLKMKYRSHR